LAGVPLSTGMGRTDGFAPCSGMVAPGASDAFSRRPLSPQSGRPRFLSRSRGPQVLFACKGSALDCPASARLSHYPLVGGRRKRRKLTFEWLAREKCTGRWSRGKIRPSWCVPPESLGAHCGRVRSAVDERVDAPKPAETFGNRALGSLLIGDVPWDNQNVSVFRGLNRPCRRDYTVIAIEVHFDERRPDTLRRPSDNGNLLLGTHRKIPVFFCGPVEVGRSAVCSDGLRGMLR
jgi:hypothetical protein